jgi:hypothetical protein
MEKYLDLKGRKEGRKERKKKGKGRKGEEK